MVTNQGLGEHVVTSRLEHLQIHGVASLVLSNKPILKACFDACMVTANPFELCTNIHEDYTGICLLDATVNPVKRVPPDTRIKFI